MLHFTRDSETPASIAQDFTSQPNLCLARAIRQINLDSIAQIGAVDRYYAPDRFIWIPWQDDIDQFEKEYIVRQLDWLNIRQRTMLANFAKRNIDVMTVVRAHRIAAYINYRMGKNEKQESFFGWIGDKAAEFFGAATAFEYEHLTKFDEAIDEVKEKLLKIKSLAEQGLKEEYHHARGEFRKSFKQLHALYEEDLRRFKISRDVLYTKYQDLEYFAMREGVKIMNIPEVSRVMKFAKYCGHVARIIWVAGVIKKGTELVEAYRDDGPWIRLAAEDVLEAGAAVLISGAIGLAFTGGGWVVVLAAGATDTIANTAVDFGIGKLMEKL